jgi:hypothetical protein
MGMARGVPIFRRNLPLRTLDLNFESGVAATDFLFLADALSKPFEGGPDLVNCH